MKSSIPKEWLRQKLDTRDFIELAKFEASQLGLTPADQAHLLSSISITYQKKWKVFLSHETRGDEPWSFLSPQETWHSLSGRAGYALVRAGDPVEVFVTRFN